MDELETADNFVYSTGLLHDIDNILNKRRFPMWNWLNGKKTVISAIA